MKKAFAGIVAIAGLATIASAATTVQYQVRTLGGTWGSSVDALPGATVEFRALVSTDAAVQGLAGFNSQPMFSNTVAGDAFAAFNGNTGVADLESGYGRRAFTGLSGVNTVNTLRGHTNLVAGVRYMRIAQNNTTNFPGSGTGANNVNGAGGVPITQYSAGLAGSSFVAQTTDLEVYRFAIVLGADTDARTLVLSAANATMIVGTATPLVARATWYDGQTAFSSITDPITSVASASINVVPTPGALALLGMGGLIAGRRRRA